jgi:hypothetical protein
MTDVRAAMAFLDRLVGRGRELQASLSDDAPSAATLAAMRGWQADVASTVNQLSGGSKAHWLSKAFSAGYLIATPSGGDRELLVEARPTEIVARLLDVIAQARASLALVAGGAAPAEPSARARFDFVHDAAIRAVLEPAFIEGTRAADAGDAERAFMTFCSVLEAILTDALGADVSSMSFDDRIAAAESAGLIRNGCARLPASARRYRSRTPADPSPTMRDAEVVRQVLRVVMRDLDPGR